ncbi:CII family transcriptional regulator [Atlantibacter hermannii]|uniref:CII family transcriptional regulator n=1 Tax=Atlantibacter hermannii TaxID=565 RepID=UPI0013EF4A1F|nr:CII family transcriptional regulator [Atlantibacter hermannii]
MEDTTSRNKHSARHIESWLHSQIAMRGASNIAKALGVDKSQITRWKETLLPRMAMLLAVLEWGVVDDDMARLAREVAAILKNEKPQTSGNSFRA